MTREKGKDNRDERETRKGTNDEKKKAAEERTQNMKKI